MFQITRYILYLLRARHRSGYGIHSPFVYNFIREVIFSENKHEFQAIEALRKHLQKDKHTFTIIDPGTGSRTRMKNTRTISQAVRNTSIKPEFGRLLFRMAGWLKPENIIELGTGVGISTSYLAAGGGQVKVFTVEAVRELADLAESNILLLGIHNVQIIRGLFKDELPELLTKVKHPMLVFIDGDHCGESINWYFETILPYASDDSIIVFDDIHWSRSMEKGWKRLIKRQEISVSIDLFQMGIVFLKKGLIKQDYIIAF